MNHSTRILACIVVIPVLVQGRYSNREHIQEKQGFGHRLVTLGTGAACIAGAIVMYDKVKHAYHIAQATTQPQGLEFFKNFKHISSLCNIGDPAVQQVLKQYSKTVGWAVATGAVLALGIHKIGQGLNILD